MEENFHSLKIKVMIIYVFQILTSVFAVLGTIIVRRSAGFGIEFKIGLWAFFSFFVAVVLAILGIEYSKRLLKKDNEDQWGRFIHAFSIVLLVGLGLGFLGLIFFELFSSLNIWINN